MRPIILITPPVWGLAAPPAGTAYLAADLEERGIAAWQYDANIFFYRWILRDRVINAACDTIEADYVASQNSGKPVRDLLRAYLLSKLVRMHVSDALGNLRSPSESIRNKSFQVIRAALMVYSSSQEQLEIGFDTCTLKGFNSASPSDLLRVAHADTPFKQFALEVLLAALPSFASTAIVAFSISFFGQLLASVSFARVIKLQYPNTVIVFGGDTTSRIVQNMEGEDRKAISRLADIFLSPGSAEDLAWLSMNDLSVRGRANFFVSTDTGLDGSWSPSPRKIGDTRPIYNHKDIPLYFSPVVELPFAASTGCSWKICSFCEYSAKTHPGGDHSSVAHIVKSLRTLKKIYQAELFTFTDSYVDPDNLRKIAEAVLADDIKIKWRCLSRIDRKFDVELLSLLKLSGCDSICFGLESYNNATLRSMRKGVTVSEIDRFMEACNAASFKPSFFILFGFPGETFSMAQKTVAFVEYHRNNIATVAPNIFLLDRRSAVFENPKAFGITDVEREAGSLNPIFRYSLNGSSITHSALVDEYMPLVEKVNSLFRNESLLENTDYIVRDDLVFSDIPDFDGSGSQMVAILSPVTLQINVAQRAWLAKLLTSGLCLSSKEQPDAVSSLLNKGFLQQLNSEKSLQGNDSLNFLRWA